MAALRHYKKLGALLLGLSILSSAGGHLLALQSIAWAAMLWSNARHDTALAAVQKTFDGKHPCGRCHQIGVDQAKHSKVPAQELERRFDLAYLTKLNFETCTWEIGCLSWRRPFTHHFSLTISPPTPPPQSFRLPA